MVIVLSPSKSLNFDKYSLSNSITLPDFLDDSQALVEILKKYSKEELSELMGISPNLAELNYIRFQNWTLPFNENNAKPCILAFTGDVYSGLKADEYSEDDLDFAQKHLRILSGLYGILRPLDLIQAYRLEMSTKLKNPRGKNLYEFWGRMLSEKINLELIEYNSGFVINLASNEYFKALKTSIIKGKIYTPIFKEHKNGKYKVVAIYAKKARGLMTRYIIRNKLNSIEDLKGFNEENYIFSEEMSTDKDLVFIR